MPGINGLREYTPLQSVFMEKMGMFGGKLHGIPEKRVALYQESQYPCYERKKDVVFFLH